jgi:hypothetical protein
MSANDNELLQCVKFFGIISFHNTATT